MRRDSNRIQFWLLISALFLLPLSSVGASQGDLARRAICVSSELEQSTRAPSRVRVLEPVKGLYESVSARDLNLGSVTTQTVERQAPPSVMLPEGGVEFQTMVRTHSPRRLMGMRLGSTVRSRGEFTRTFSHDGHVMWMNAARLEHDAAGSSRFIDVPHVLPLVPGRGIPTQAYVTLMQMRRAGIHYGALREVFGTVNNERTLKELAGTGAVRDWMAVHPGETVPGSLIARELLRTHTGQYVSTVLTQSGHRIVKIEVTPVGASEPGVQDFFFHLTLAPW